MPDDKQYEGVSVVKRANVFGEKCVSHTVIFADGTRKTLGVFLRGKLTIPSVVDEELEILAEDFDANRLAVRIGEVLHLNAARQAHEMLEGLLPKRPGKIVLSGYGAMR